MCCIGVEIKKKKKKKAQACEVTPKAASSDWFKGF